MRFGLFCHLMNSGPEDNDISVYIIKWALEDMGQLEVG